MTLNFAYFNGVAAITSRVDRIVPSRWSRDFARALRPETLPMMDYVRQTARRGDLFLVPPDLERFRLRAGAPIVADFKSHPYKDVEVLDWFSRLQLVDAFYQSGGDCDALASILARYPVTHVVFDDRARPARCNGLVELYTDPVFDIYRVGARANATLERPEWRRSLGATASRSGARSALSLFCSVCRLRPPLKRSSLGLSSSP